MLNTIKNELLKTLVGLLCISVVGLCIFLLLIGLQYYPLILGIILVLLFAWFIGEMVSM